MNLPAPLDRAQGPSHDLRDLLQREPASVTNLWPLEAAARKTSRCSTSPCASMQQFCSLFQASSQGGARTVPQRGCLSLDCSSLPTHRGAIEGQDRCCSAYS